MTEAAYYNVHGQPLALSAKDAVLAREPLAYVAAVDGYTTTKGEPWPLLEVRRASPMGKRLNTNTVLGAGAREEAAWRDALSRMRIADNEEAARG